MNKPVDAYFVLGGSIQREIHVAQLAKENPDIPILISNGSDAPCVWILFQREGANLDSVWLEKCAKNTFRNFYYSVPILRQWGGNHVKLITSETHLPRAKWMAKIQFAAQGIWVTVDIAKETGIPGNREYWWKTFLDVTRSLLWGFVSPLIQPQCQDIIKLGDVNMSAWEEIGFKCERSAGIN
ncbi:MAG: YdcF family protein [Chroococcales cyanobacterium]